MLNVVAIMGRLARDPEMKMTQSGKHVITFRIACDRGRKDENGQSVADWLDVIAWDKTAEFVDKYFRKGSLIIVDGSIQTRTYQAKDGSKRTAVEILARNVNFAGGKTTDTASAEPPMGKQFQQGNNDDFTVITDDDDLPF